MSMKRVHHNVQLMIIAYSLRADDVLLYDDGLAPSQIEVSRAEISCTAVGGHHQTHKQALVHCRTIYENITRFEVSYLYIFLHCINVSFVFLDSLF